MARQIERAAHYFRVASRVALPCTAYRYRASKVAPEESAESKAAAFGQRTGAQLWGKLRRRAAEKAKEAAEIRALGLEAELITPAGPLARYDWKLFSNRRLETIGNRSIASAIQNAGQADVLDPFVRFTVSAPGEAPHVKSMPCVADGGCNPDFNAMRHRFHFKWPNVRKKPITMEQAAVALQRIVRGRQQRRLTRELSAQRLLVEPGPGTVRREQAAQIGLRRLVEAKIRERRAKAANGVVVKVEVFDREVLGDDRPVGSGLVDMRNVGKRGKPILQMVELHDAQGFFAGCVFLSLEMCTRTRSTTEIIDDDESSRQTVTSRTGQLDVVLFGAQSLLDVREIKTVEATNNRMVWLSTMVVLIYLATGCVFYALAPNALGEGQEAASFIDGIYFSAATLTTVGYGDMGPQTTATRMV